MRIVFVTNKSYPNPRGSSGGLENFCRELIQRGNEVFVIASTQGNNQISEETIFRYTVSEIWGKRWVWNRGKIFKRLEELYPDIVHIQQYDGLGSVARQWALRNRVPWVQTVSDAISVQKSKKVKEVPSRVVVSARAVGQMLKKENPDRYLTFDVIPIGVIEENFVGGDGSLVRREWSIPEEATILLSVSRLAQEKNTEFLFRALLPIICARRDVYLLCVGGGELLDSIRDSIVREGLQERVFFSDEVPKEKMKHYFSAGNIFVYASKEDFRATVVTEAMYAGLPVVAVASGGAQERVLDKVTGFLVDEREENFMEAVRILIKDPERARSFGRSGHTFSQENYMNKKSVDALVEVYKEVIKGT